MTHSVVYNGKPIEEMNKPALLSAMEAVCAQLENYKESVKYWERKYKEVVSGTQ